MINKDGTVVVGVKGKSGRKSADYETTKRRAIGKAWEKVDKELETKGVEKIALPLALKDMVTKVGNPDGSSLTPLLVKFIDGKEPEDNSDTDRVQETVR